MALPEPTIVIPENHKAAADILKEIQAEIKPMVKPANWGRRSVSSYYRLKFALEVKKVVDGMIADNEDRVYYYDKFTKLPHKFTPSTLYTYVYQALKFLKTEDIPDVDKEYYKRVTDRIITTREPGVGVRLSFHTDVAAAYVDIVPDTVIKKSDNEGLKDKIDTWIQESAPGDLLSINNIALSELEVIEIENQLAGTEGFLVCDIRTNGISIRKR